MEEQMTAQGSNYDISADGAVNAGYDEEALETSQAETPETPAEPEELPPDGVRLNNDGEIEFGEQFFGEMEDRPEEPPEQAEQEAPKYYTDEELDQIPFTQWDLSRLNGDVGKYAVIVQRQLQRRQEYARSQEVQSRPMPSDIVQPKEYTPKELAEDALKLACEKLGLEDVDDFDSYENEHKAAYELASQELIQKRNAEMSGYQTALQTWQENARYQEELTRRPDFNEFNAWYMAECQKAGLTQEQVNAELYKLVKQNGNNFGVIRQVQETWYKEFQRTKPAGKPGSIRRVPPITGRRRTEGLSQFGTSHRNMSQFGTSSPKPAVLESTRGNNYGGRQSIRAEAFAEMSDDEQADALIQLGLVD